MRRFRFVPFWRVTRWGFIFENWRHRVARPLWIERGCDEFHNLSRYLIVPLVGEFVLFDRGYNVDQAEHLSAYSNGEWFGVDVPGCRLCAEIKGAIESDA